MHDGRLRQLEALFHAARRLPGDDRAAFLCRECSDDGSLRAQVERLLDAHDEPHDLIDADRIPPSRLLAADAQSDHDADGSSSSAGGNAAGAALWREAAQDVPQPAKAPPLER